MPNIVISLNENQLKITTTTKKGEFKTASFLLPKEVAKDSTILDSNLFAQATADLITQMFGKQPKNLQLTFLAAPQDVFFKFITVNKRDGDIGTQVLADAKETLPGVDFDSLYFSYEKMAPFVFQFIALKKTLVEKFIEVSNILGADLHAILPWPVCLPKFLNTTEPCIFISHEANKQVVLLSELNSIYFSEVYKTEVSITELEKLVHQLSIYKKSTPVNKIYTLDAEEFSIDPTYSLVNIKFPNLNPAEYRCFETHALVTEVLRTNPEILTSESNVLNMLPLPVVEKKSTALVYVGSAVMLLLVMGGVFSFVMYKSKNSPTNLSTDGANTPVVLSDTSTKETTPTSPEPIKKVLNKNDIKIRVENGSGIPGVAAKTQTVLQDLTYVVPEIGNSDGDNRKNTLIKIKKSKVDYKDLLIADLKTTYDLVVEDGLDESLTYDVLITVGAK